MVPIFYVEKPTGSFWLSRSSSFFSSAVLTTRTKEFFASCKTWALFLTDWDTMNALFKPYANWSWE